MVYRGRSRILAIFGPPGARKWPKSGTCPYRPLINCKIGRMPTKTLGGPSPIFQSFAFFSVTFRADRAKKAQKWPRALGNQNPGREIFRPRGARAPGPPGPGGARRPGAPGAENFPPRVLVSQGAGPFLGLFCSVGPECHGKKCKTLKNRARTPQGLGGHSTDFAVN